MCIGHGPSPVQQAIRASGVASHPAQTAGFPATKPRHRRTADNRWASATVSRMLDGGRDVKQAKGASVPVRARAQQMGNDNEREDREPDDPEQIFPPSRLSRRDRLNWRRNKPWGAGTCPHLLACAGRPMDDGPKILSIRLGIVDPPLSQREDAREGPHKQNRRAS